MSNFTDFIGGGGGGGSEVNDNKVINSFDSLITTASGEKWLQSGTLNSDTTTYADATSLTTGATYANTNWSIASQMTHPSGITWDGSFFWVCDRLNTNAIFKYNAAGVYQSVNFTTTDTENMGVFWDGSNFYVAGSLAGVVHRYSSSGVKDTSWAITGLSGIVGVAKIGTIVYAFVQSFGGASDVVKPYTLTSSGGTLGTTFSTNSQTGGQLQDLTTDGNIYPAQHWMRTIERGTGGGAVDYYGIFYHGIVTTHLDALCHVWSEDGMWNGHDPAKEITFDGAKFGSVDGWADGIITRGVLIDIPRHRGEPYVTHQRPVHGWELEEAAKAQGLVLEPGDALVVYSGRERWTEDHPEAPWGTVAERPGLHASCLPFIRDNDVSVLVWDMMDFTPYGYDIPWSVHGVIFAYGVALLDNAILQPLAEACVEEGRYEFMLMILPLKVVGGTGSPVNPIALF